MLASLILSLAAQAPTAHIGIDATQLGHPVPKSLYGIFFEEINQAGDGGIYAELLRSRGLEGSNGNELPPGWRATGSVALDREQILNPARPVSLRLEPGSAAINDGYWGVPLRSGAKYRLVVWAKGSGPLQATLGRSTKLGDLTGSWRRYETTLTAVANDEKGSLSLAPSTGRAWIAFASLTPVETWKGRANGLRKDLAQAVDAMRPGFVRFPGGCYVEGGDRLADAFDWKRSVAPLQERRGLDRSMWGYPNTFGLGYHEYLRWCEDMGSAPLFVVNCGLSHREMTPMAEMDRWVQNTLDAIEYANGPATSKWGAVRARNGHPKPFGLKYIEIGNENGYSWAYGGPAAYEPRYRLIYDAIKKRYPEIVTVADIPVPHPMEIVDEHYYMSPSWFWQNSTRYDAYPRAGPKIYVGEYAVTQGAGNGNLAAALAEAAFMVGMERNSDVVTMASYAPLFVNVGNKQWNPDAIVFDNSRWYGTPSYHVQRLFGANRPTRLVKHTVTAPIPPYAVGGTVGLQTWRSQAEFKDLRVEADGKPVTLSNDWRFGRGQWSTDGGVIRQTADGDDRRAMLKGLDLSGAHHYRIDLKARKTGGDEGFIVMFNAKNDRDYLMWNVGGWGNTRHAFEKGSGGGRSGLGRGVNGSVETGRWYDLRIEGDGPRVRAYLDGNLVEEVVDQAVPDFTAIAGVDERTGELVIKAVNGSDEPREVQFDLGPGRFGPMATAEILTGPNLAAENSFDRPAEVAPVKSNVPVPVPAKEFGYRLMPRSVTVLRIKRR